jgi:H+/Cl- antiporter ClcA
MSIKEGLKWLLLSLLAGCIGGLSSTLFLKALYTVTDLFTQYPFLIFGLPFAGFIIGWLYYRYDTEKHFGMKLLTQEMQVPLSPIPLKMGVLVFLGTLTSHLFGGSAGRESTAVQTSASFADVVGRFINLTPLGYSIWVRTLMSAGFGSVFGTPLAGACFGIELRGNVFHTMMGVIPCLLASYTGNWLTTQFITQHSYVITQYPSMSLSTLGWAMLAGLCIGAFSFGFKMMLRRIKFFFTTVFETQHWRAFVGGCVLVILAVSLNIQPYLGLGLPLLSHSFDTMLPWFAPFAKLITTTLTLGSGFKGGEITPLFVSGAAFGNLLAQYLPLPLTFLAGLGLFSTFSSSTRLPLTGICLGLDLFGWPVLPWAVLVCLIAHFSGGKESIYD